MTADLWRTILIAALGVSAATGFSYRVYRYKRGGPLGDVWGQAVLALLLLGLAGVLLAGGDWARWPALVYALLFAFVVMPLWTLAVLIPLPPGRIDYAFTGVYWATLLVIGTAALLV